MNSVVDVTEESFKHEVLGSDKPVFVIFRAEWCALCKSMLQIFDGIIDSYKDRLTIASVDIAKCPGMIQQFEISALPFLLIVHGGEIAERYEGLGSKANVLQFVENYMNQNVF